MERPLVSVVMGSASDKDKMKGAVDILREFEVPFEVRVISAHRSPDIAFEFAKSARERGIEVIIAGAGGAAHLPGVLASLTTLPVIGVPIDSTPLKGLDSLYSIVQMPPGIPVATVGIDSSANAGLLAVRILSIKYPEYAEKLERYRENLKEKVLSSKVEY
jgi:5-(carboxyamino)imidazole ribonucleotide mutase